MPIVLLCPHCGRPFAEEPTADRMEKTIENVRTLCVEHKELGLPARKLKCFFCGCGFDIDDCYVREVK